jgi:hypothetical protein
MIPALKIRDDFDVCPSSVSFRNTEETPVENCVAFVSHLILIIAVFHLKEGTLRCLRNILLCKRVVKFRSMSSEAATKGFQTEQVLKIIGKPWFEA